MAQRISQEALLDNYIDLIKMKIVFALTLLFAIAYWADVGGRLTLPEKVADVYKIDFNKITVKLEGEGISSITYPYTNGVFKFTNIPVGNYVITIDDVDYFYDSVAVEVYLSKDKELIRATSYDIKNGKGGIMKHPVHLSPVGPKAYDEVKEPFNVFSLLKNPMVLMMLVSVGLVFLMNKMPKPDKEQMNEMNKQMGSMKMPSFLTPS